MKNPDDPDNLGRYVAGAIAFAGRPDLTWLVAEDLVKKLFAEWKSLTSFAGDLPPAPATGYRGCFLRYNDDVELFAFGGVVTMMTRVQTESRTDKARSIERLILDSSPEGMLPAEARF